MDTIQTNMNCKITKICENSGRLLFHVDHGKGLLRLEHSRVDNANDAENCALFFGNQPLARRVYGERCRDELHEISAGFGMDKIRDDFFSEIAETLNAPFVNLETSFEALQPLFALLRTGLYFLYEKACIPTDGNGKFFWQCNNDLNLNENSDMTSSRDHYIPRNLYLLSTQMPTLYDPDRVAQYRGRNDLRALAYSFGTHAVLLDGHQKATACALDGRLVNTLMICDLDFDYYVTRRGLSSSNCYFQSLNQHIVQSFIKEDSAKHFTHEFSSSGKLSDEQAEELLAKYPIEHCLDYRNEITPCDDPDDIVGINDDAVDIVGINDDAVDIDDASVDGDDASVDGDDASVDGDDASVDGDDVVINLDDLNGFYSMIDIDYFFNTNAFEKEMDELDESFIVDECYYDDFQWPEEILAVEKKSEAFDALSLELNRDAYRWDLDDRRDAEAIVNATRRRSLKNPPSTCKVSPIARSLGEIIFHVENAKKEEEVIHERASRYYTHNVLCYGRVPLAKRYNTHSSENGLSNYRAGSFAMETLREELFGDVHEALDMPFIDIESSFQSLRPFFTHLATGFYSLSEQNFPPLSCDGSFFWQRDTELRSEESELFCYNYKGVSSTQPPTQFDRDRLARYRGRNDLCALAFYHQNATVLLHGHHKATAAALDGRLIKTLLVKKISSERSLELFLIDPRNSKVQGFSYNDFLNLLRKYPFDTELPQSKNTCTPSDKAIFEAANHVESAPEGFIWPPESVGSLERFDFPGMYFTKLWEDGKIRHNYASVYHYEKS